MSALVLSLVQASFRPERAIFPNLGVNPRVYLCDVQEYASAQTLGFLDLGKTISFPNRKRATVAPEFPDRHKLGSEPIIYSTGLIGANRWRRRYCPSLPGFLSNLLGCYLGRLDSHLFFQKVLTKAVLIEILRI